MSDSGITKKLGRAVPPKARLMMAISGVIIVGAGALTINMFDSAAPVESGQVDLELDPSKANIDRPRPGEQTIVPDESDIGQALAARRRQDLENALNGDGGSLTEAIQIPAPESTIEQGPSLSQTPEQVLGEIDQLRASRRARQGNGASTNAVTNASGGGLNYSQFIEQELSALEGFSEGANAQISRIVSNSTSVQRSQSGTARTASSPSPVLQSRNGTAGDGQLAAQSSLSAQDYVSSFVRRPSQLSRPETDQERLERYRVSPANGSVVESQRSDGGAATNRLTAGTILYAVLDTGVDSDSTTHVKATIVQEGPFKDATVLGDVTLAGDKVVLQFNQMGHDGKDYSISAVAVDPTSPDQMTALADSVDYHTLQRYGMLWGAAFLEGYADALTNTTTVTNTDGSQLTLRERTPEASEQALVAAGRVGARTVPMLERQFNRPPTVYVSARRPIGLMLLQGIAY